MKKLFVLFALISIFNVNSQEINTDRFSYPNYSYELRIYKFQYFTYTDYFDLIDFQFFNGYHQPYYSNWYWWYNYQRNYIWYWPPHDYYWYQPSYYWYWLPYIYYWHQPSYYWSNWYIYQHKPNYNIYHHPQTTDDIYAPRRVRSSTNNPLPNSNYTPLHIPTNPPRSPRTIRSDQQHIQRSPRTEQSNKEIFKKNTIAPSPTQNRSTSEQSVITRPPRSNSNTIKPRQPK